MNKEASSHGKFNRAKSLLEMGSRNLTPTPKATLASSTDSPPPASHGLTTTGIELRRTKAALKRSG
jgi:hypothetical protein